MKETKKILTAAVLCTSMIFAGSNSVLAAETYQDIESSALSSLASSLSDVWDSCLSNYEKSSAGSSADITVYIEDAGRAMLGTMAGMDVSWLQSISLNSNVSVENGISAIASSLLLNNTRLCDLNMFMDFQNMAEYIQIPELSDSFIKAPIASDTPEDTEEMQQFMDSYMDLMSDFSSLMPDSSTISTLLDRYGNIIIENMEEGTSVAETVSVDGIGEDCTAYEAFLSERSLASVAEAVLNAAKDDSDIKTLYEQWASSPEFEGNSYEEFQAEINSLIQDISSVDPSELSSDAVLVSKIWTDSEGEIVGRQFSVIDDMETVPVFTWKAPSDENAGALLIEVSADDTSLILTGSGQYEDGLLNGNYIFAIDGVESLDIEAENLEVHPEKSGYYNGILHISFPETGDADMDSLSSFGIDLILRSDAEQENSAFDLTLTTSGVPLATLSVTGGYGEKAGLPDFSSLSQTYDASSDESMTGYLESVSWDLLITNLKGAGLPEDLADQLSAVFEASVDAALYPEETSVDADAA